MDGQVNTYAIRPTMLRHMAKSTLDWVGVSGATLRLAFSLLYPPGVDAVQAIEDLAREFFARPNHTSEGVAIRRTIAALNRQLQSQYQTFDYSQPSASNPEKLATLEAVKALLSSRPIDYNTIEECNFDPTQLKVRLEHPFTVLADRHLLSEASRQYGRDLITTVATQLIALIIDSPKFDADISLKTYLLMKDTDKRYLRALNQVFLPTWRDGTDLEEAKFEAAYLSEIVRKYGRTELFGLTDLPAALKSSALNVTYISLTTTDKLDPNSIASVATKSHIAWTPAADDQRQTVETALGRLGDERSDERGVRLAVAGAAGSGKTTVLQWIATNLALSRRFGDLPNGLDRFRGRLPFLIRLRTAVPSDSTLLTVETLMDNLTTSQLRPGSWLVKVLTSGAAILLFDGIDELSESRRRHALDWIEALGEQFPLIDIVVTSRPEAIDMAFLSRLTFSLVMMRPMTPSQARRAIRQWYDAQCQTVNRRYAQIYREREAALLSALDRDVAVEDLCATPLLAAMLCAYYAAGSIEVTGNRMQLIGDVIDVLVDGRDRARGAIPDDFLAFSLNQKKMLLARIAKTMFEQAARVFSVGPTGFHGSSKVFVGSQAVPLRLSSSVVPLDASLHYLIRRSSILHRVGNREGQFAHALFLEYLAGFWYAEKGTWLDLVAQQSLPGWYSTISAFSHIAPDYLSEKLVLWLVDQHVKASEAPSRRMTYALADCFGNLTEYEDDVYVLVAGVLKSCLPPSTDEEVALLAPVGASILELLEDPSSLEEASVYLKTAAAIRGDAGLALMKRLATGPFGRSLRDGFMNAWYRFPAKAYADAVLSVLSWDDIDIRVPSEDGLLALEVLLPLHGVVVSRCDGVQDLSWLPKDAGIVTLDLEHMRGLERLDGVARAGQLRRLRTAASRELVSVSGLADTRSVQTLDIPCAAQVADLSPLSNLSSLTALSLADVSFAGLQSITGALPSSIRRLSVRRSRISNVEGLFRNLLDLRVLNLEASTVAHICFEDSNGVCVVPSLQELSLTVDASTCIDVTSLGSSVRSLIVSTPIYHKVFLVGLERLTGLTKLSLDGPIVILGEVGARVLLDEPRKTSEQLYRWGSNECTLLDLPPLPLTSLHVSNNPGLQDLHGIERCTSLEVVDFSHTSLTEIDSLEGLPKLSDVSLNSCVHVDSLKPLASVPSLEVLRIHGIANFMIVEEFEWSRKDVEVIADRWLFVNEVS